MVVETSAMWGVEATAFSSASGGLMCDVVGGTSAMCREGCIVANLNSFSAFIAYHYVFLKGWGWMQLMECLQCECWRP